MSKVMMDRMSRLIFVVVLCFFNTGARASLQEGLEAFRSGNHSVALEKLRPLADQGNAVAQLYLGKIYMQGVGTQPDNNKAIFWARKAAKQKNTEAEYFMGFLYYYGLGTPQDYTEAMSWYLRAAEVGDVKAQSALGMMFVNGLGKPQDLVQAYKWLKLAEIAGLADAGSKLRAVEEKMTAQQIKEGEVLVKKWQPTQETKSETKSKPRKSKRK
jgi:uncharacterized protein